LGCGRRPRCVICVYLWFYAFVFLCVLCVLCGEIKDEIAARLRPLAMTQLC
jgi:hypothetical protein